MEHSPAQQYTGYDPSARKDITHETTVTDGPKASDPTPASEKPADDKLKQARADMKAKLKKLDIARENLTAFITENGKFKDIENPTLAELLTFNKKLDVMIQQKQQAADDELPME
jgi:hypothetical protein